MEELLDLLIGNEGSLQQAEQVVQGLTALDELEAEVEDAAVYADRLTDAKLLLNRSIAAATFQAVAASAVMNNVFEPRKSIWKLPRLRKGLCLKADSVKQYGGSTFASSTGYPVLQEQERSFEVKVAANDLVSSVDSVSTESDSLTVGLRLKNSDVVKSPIFSTQTGEEPEVLPLIDQAIQGLKIAPSGLRELIKQLQGNPKLGEQFAQNAYESIFSSPRYREAKPIIVKDGLRLIKEDAFNMLNLSFCWWGGPVRMAKKIDQAEEGKFQEARPQEEQQKLPNAPEVVSCLAGIDQSRSSSADAFSVAKIQHAQNGWSQRIQAKRFRLAARYLSTMRIVEEDRRVPHDGVTLTSAQLRHHVDSSRVNEYSGVSMNTRVNEYSGVVRLRHLATRDSCSKEEHEWTPAHLQQYVRPRVKMKSVPFLLPYWRQKSLVQEEQESVLSVSVCFHVVQARRLAFVCTKVCTLTRLVLFPLRAKWRVRPWKWKKKTEFISGCVPDAT
jgi:hypothetical protein